MAEIEDIEYEAYLHGEEYYAESWENIREHNASRFNIYACLFGIFWLLYRKMYAFTLILIGGLFVLTYLEELTFTHLGLTEETKKVASYSVNILTAILLGIFANRLYLWEAKKRIKRVKALQLPEEEHLMALQKRGGSTLMPLIIIAALILGVLLLFTMANN